MTQKNGKLIRQGKNIMVQLPNKSGGTTNFPVPMAAKCFLESDFKEGIDAVVELDSANRITSVTIVGASEVQPSQPTSTKPKPGSNLQKRPFVAPSNSRSATNQGVRSRVKAPAKTLGEAFHNPYTFIDFENGPVSERKPATLLTQDEVEIDRITGVLELRVETLSPLLTSHPVPVSPETVQHKTYRALTIGNDVIVPATGIRGALRTLMTILTNGTLGYLDKTAFLIQGRDTKLSPSTPNTRETAPEHVYYLGEVLTRGSDTRDGVVRLGETKLVSLIDLEALFGRDGLNRAPSAKHVWVQLDSQGRPKKISDRQSADTPWRLRLSGKPVGGRRIEERKKEAVFKPGSDIISIPAKLWADYCGRNQFGDRPMLRPGDLVWLEPKRTADGVSFRTIRSGEDVRSLQWARWGKTGDELKTRVPSALYPDSWAKDGKVDEVTDLFGQVGDLESRDGEDFYAASFAGRIRPENLVFYDAAQSCEKTVLAPLAPPHPGCLAFYRSTTDPDNVDFKDMLRGYKVYRTTEETGKNGPWNYDVQGVYDRGQLKPPTQNVNKTVELLPAGRIGTLRIAFHGMTKRELALLVQACEVPWRLGGGKPLGLGRCRVSVTGVVDEFGSRTTVAEVLGADWKTLVENIQHRIRLWEASQAPVKRLRYPRAVNGNSRGGHAWFQYFGRPRMVSAPDNGPREKGLMPVYIAGALREKVLKDGHELDPSEPMISGQTLPKLSATDPNADLLFGYDVIGHAQRDRRATFEAFEPFDPSRHDLGQNRKEPNQGKNAEARRNNRTEQ